LAEGSAGRAETDMLGIRRGSVGRAVSANAVPGPPAVRAVLAVRGTLVVRAVDGNRERRASATDVVRGCAPGSFLSGNRDRSASATDTLTLR
jgi:hypothetical protein